MAFMIPQNRRIPPPDPEHMNKVKLVEACAAVYGQTWMIQMIWEIVDGPSKGYRFMTHQEAVR